MKVSDSLPVCPPPYNDWAGTPLAPQHPQPQHAHQVGAIGDALLAMKITTDQCEFDREDNFTAFKKQTSQPWPVPAVSVAVCPKRNASDQVLEESHW